MPPYVCNRLESKSLLGLQGQENPLVRLVAQEHGSILDFGALIR